MKFNLFFILFLCISVAFSAEFKDGKIIEIVDGKESITYETDQKKWKIVMIYKNKEKKWDMTSEKYIGLGYTCREAYEQEFMKNFFMKQMECSKSVNEKFKLVSICMRDKNVIETKKVFKDDGGIIYYLTCN